MAAYFIVIWLTTWMSGQQSEGGSERTRPSKKNFAATWPRAVPRQQASARRARDAHPVSPEMMRLLALVSLAIAASAVKEHDFRKCRDTPFCGRHREPPAEGAEPFRVGSVNFLPVEGATRGNECSGLTATLVAPDATRAQLPLVLSLSVLATGAVRVLIDEDSSISSNELHRADPSVARPAEWDEDMDGPWDAPMLKLGRAVKGRFAPTDALAHVEHKPDTAWVSARGATGLFGRVWPKLWAAWSSVWCRESQLAEG